MLPQLPAGNNAYYCGAALELPKDTVFVFGSNTGGRHGAGAALTAVREYGAVYGQGEGLMGRSYALPTKRDTGLVLVTMTLEEIAESVQRFRIAVSVHPELRWYVTPFGTGLAGYTAADIAPMLKGITNCYLPLAWRDYL